MTILSRDPQGPTIIIDQPDLDFGLIRFGDSTRRPLWLRNQSQINCPWEVRLLPDVANDFAVLPTSGILRPLEEFLVSIIQGYRSDNIEVKLYQL